MSFPTVLDAGGQALAAAAEHTTTHLTYLEAGVVGLIQGVTELFPVSSLGHNVLIPALVGGSWETDLNVGSAESPYLAFIVGLHVATAIGLLVYFWRDWLRIIGGFFTSLKQVVAPAPGTGRWELSVNQRLAWMIILGTVPVGLVGLAFEHQFRVLFAHAIYAAWFLMLNGLILLAGERFRRRSSKEADKQVIVDRDLAMAGAARSGSARHASGHQAERNAELVQAIESDRRLSSVGMLESVLIGSSQILALFAGISRDGVVMVSGMFRGLSREDAARFSFLLSTPVIFAAGVLKAGDLTGPLGKGIHGPILFGSILSGVGAYLSVRFLVRYFRTSTLNPFGIYCLVAGLGCVIYLGLIK
jgi:undecaprenyl-diphosphatase